MCALFGWLDYHGKISPKVLQKLTQALANAAEERGTDASGISYVKGDRMTIYKRPKPAHKMKFRVPAGTAALMGHTRLTTQGNQKHNYNNHPFRGFAGQEFAFAHNGVLYNDRELQRTKKLPVTKIETDSYIGVQLIEQNGDLSFESLAQMAEDVSGNFTFTLLDAENSLYFVKGSSPLYLMGGTLFGWQNPRRQTDSAFHLWQHQKRGCGKAERGSVSEAGGDVCPPTEYPPRRLDAPVDP